MGKPIPLMMRKRIVELCQSGKSAKQVSEQLKLGYAGVAKIWRLYRLHGEASLQIKYDRCGRKSEYGSSIRQAIDTALGENKDLGAPIIRSRLIAQGKYDKVPHERTIQRWWKAQGKNKARGRRPASNRSYTQQAHHTWQIDAKEKVAIQDGSLHCYLSFADEATCSFLKGHLFPLYCFVKTNSCFAS